MDAMDWEEEWMAHMFCRGMMDSKLNQTERWVLSFIYKSLPNPPVSAAAATLSPGDNAAWVAAEGVDRISGLPVEILRDIVGRLPAKDAARTTALSTRWRRLWYSVPLALVDVHLLRDFGYFCSFPDTRALTAAVSHVLAVHPGPFRCVNLSCIPMAACRPEISRWLQNLAAKGVEELVFINRPGRYLRLPAVLFRCGASLTSLHIGLWKFPDTAKLPRAAGAAFPHLRELGLSSIFIQEGELELLLDNCPVLERLVMIRNLALVRLRVSHSLRCVHLAVSTLEELTVVHAANLQRLLLMEVWGPVKNHIKLVAGCSVLPPMCVRIKICDAPNLRILGFLVPGVHQLQIGNSVIKAGTKASPMSTVPSVQLLAIQVKLGECNRARMISGFLRCFPNVETLYVQPDHHSADDPTARINVKFWKEAGPIECVQWHIKKLVFREFQGLRSEHNFLMFIAESAHVLEKMVVVLTHGCSVDQEGAKLRTFMASAKWAKRDCELMIVPSPFHAQGSGDPVRLLAMCFSPPEDWAELYLMALVVLSVLQKIDKYRLRMLLLGLIDISELLNLWPKAGWNFYNFACYDTFP